MATAMSGIFELAAASFSAVVTFDELGAGAMSTCSPGATNLSFT